MAAPTAPHPGGYRLRVTGPSMERPGAFPTFPAGSIIEVDPAAPVEPGDFVVARLPHLDHLTFRQFHVDACGGEWLLALNPAFPPIPVGAGVALHRVVMLARVPLDRPRVSARLVACASA